MFLIPILESVWILGRDRVPDGPVLQQAYGVLDKYKISRTFFVKTDQTDCEVEGKTKNWDDKIHQIVKINK